MSIYENMSPDVQRVMVRERVVNSEQAAETWGVSLPQWRRMYRTGQVPAPIQLSERRIGWRLGTLLDALSSREKAA